MPNGSGQRCKGKHTKINVYEHVNRQIKVEKESLNREVVEGKRMICSERNGGLVRFRKGD